MKTVQNFPNPDCRNFGFTIIQDMLTFNTKKTNSRTFNLPILLGVGTMGHIVVQVSPAAHHPNKVRSIKTRHQHH